MALEKFQRQPSGNWYIRGTVLGREIYKSTKTSNEEAAEAIRIQTEGGVLKEAVHGASAVATFEKAVESYLATGGRERTGGSPRFLGKYNPQTDKWDGLMGMFGPRIIGTITPDDLHIAANKLFPGRSHITRNRQCYAPFISVYRHAQKKKWCLPQEWERPQAPKGTKKVVKKPRNGSFPVEYDHAAKFVLAMSPAPAMIMTTLFYTGMRPIELFTLEADQVDVAERWIELPASKTGEPRGVPMHEMLVPMFAGLVARGGYLFRTSKGQPYAQRDEPEEGVTSGGQMASAINGARRRSGITDISPYTGRHSVSTGLVDQGVHPHTKDQIMGHAVGHNMSRLYTRQSKAPLIKAINTLPVIKEWADAPWLSDPLTYAGKLIEGTGKRTDLATKRKQRAANSRKYRAAARARLAA